MSKLGKPMRVYLMRHGKTSLNQKNVFQYKDTPLLVESRERVLNKAKYFEGSGIEAIVSSDYLRAEETARIIASQIRAKVETSSLLGEIRRPREVLGKWHYSPHSLWAMILLLLNSLRKEWHYSDEENPYEHYLRTKEILGYIENRKEKKFIVVSHRVTITTLIRVMKNRGRIFTTLFAIPIAYMNGMKNSSILVCDFDGKRWDISPL